MGEAIHHKVILVRVETDAFVFAGVNRDFKMKKEPNLGDLQLGSIALIEERSDGKLHFKERFEEEILQGEVHSHEFWVEQTVELQYEVNYWTASSEVGSMIIHRDVIWPDSSARTRPYIKIGLVRRLEQPMKIDNQSIMYWELMGFRPNMEKMFSLPVIDVPLMFSRPAPQTVTWETEEDWQGMVERVGVVAQIQNERGNVVARIFTPLNAGRDPVIIFPRDAQPLETKQWIIFRAPSDLPSKYHIREYRCVNAMLPTEDFGNTIKIKLNDFKIPEDIDLDRMLMHPLLGGIYDPNILLKPGVTMSFEVLRRKPDPGRKMCSWFVSHVLLSNEPIAPVKEDIPLAASETEISHDTDSVEEGGGVDKAKEEMAPQEKRENAMLQEGEVHATPQELFDIISKMNGFNVSEDATHVIRYYGDPRGCDVVILADQMQFHLKKEAFVWRYPFFGDLLKKETNNGEIWKVGVPPDILMLIFDMMYNYELQDAEFMMHDTDAQVFWRTVIDIFSLLAEWKVDHFHNYIVKDALFRHCFDPDCWRCVNRVALAHVKGTPSRVPISKRAVQKWKTNCLPILSPFDGAIINLPRLVTLIEEQAE